MERALVPILLAVAVSAVLASRLPFGPPALEDIDSVNFALSLREFAPVKHQPHPPGFPVYVGLARALHGGGADDATTLARLSALAQGLAVVPFYAIARHLTGSAAHAVGATVLLFTVPVLWFNGARPMSDSFGLLLALSAQALLLRALDRPRLVAASSLATGLAFGARVQALALTLPLWFVVLARHERERAKAAAALALGVVVWGAPLVVASGGPSEYVRAFGFVAAQSLPVEPLLTDFTVNRAVQAARLVFLGPWVSPLLAAAALLAAATGAWALWRTRPKVLGLALLLSGPYLAAHALLQQVAHLRYSLPYLPLFAILAAEGLALVVARLRPRWRLPAFAALVTAFAACAAVATLPALRAYAATPSPALAAVRELRRVARPPAEFVVARHYNFDRYLLPRTPDLHVLETAPGRALHALRAHWLSGDRRTALLLAESRRTDLESVDPSARHVLGRWRWPEAVRPFLGGARPRKTELLRFERPHWFTGPGWLLSLEAGRPSEQRRIGQRQAWLDASPEATFLLLAGEPLDPGAARAELEWTLDGAPLARTSCGRPLLAGHVLAGVDGPPRYRELTARSTVDGEPAGAAFALRGLAHGPLDGAAHVHGGGWHYPESDPEARPFRWTARTARSLVYVPPAGAVLRIEGTVPPRLEGTEVTLTVSGAPPSGVSVVRGRFSVEVALDQGTSPFREVVLEATRDFVPDDHQWNGDRRRLALRVHHFSISPRVPAAR